MSLGGALREVVAKLGIEITGQDKLAQTNKSVDTATGALRGFGALLAGSAIVAGLRNFVDGFTEAGSALQDASDRLGVTTDDLQELQYAFGQAGVRGEQLNAALTGLSQRMEQAQRGTGPAAGAFHSLGVRLRDAHGAMRPVADVMDDVAINMEHIHDPARRVQLATQLFGGAGRRLVGVLHDGSGGLAEMRARFRELGGGMTTDGVHAADAFGDAMQDLDVATTGLKTQLAIVLLPALRSVSEFITKAITTVGRFTHGTNLAHGALAAAATVLATQFIPALAALAAGVAAPLAATVILALVVDDLMAAFKGGPSILGDFIDSMEGVGATQNAIQSLKESWEELGDTIRSVREAMSWDPSGETSARGTRGARGRPGMAPIERSRAQSLLANPDAQMTPADRAALQRMVDTHPDDIRGRTSSGGRAAGAGLSAATARQDAAFGLQEAYSGRAQVRGSLPSVTTSVMNRTNQVFQISVQQLHGESGEAFARRVAARIQQTQESSADANHPVPQNAGQ